jgi:hypothetical protein
MHPGSVMVFKTACDSALTTSVVLKRLPLILSSIGVTEKSRRRAKSGELWWVGDSHVVFGKEFHGEK